MGEKLLCFYDFAHSIGNFFKFFKKYVIRTIDDDLCEAGNGATLNILTFGFLDHAECKLLEMPFKQLQLLLSVLDATKYVPLELTKSLADHWVQFHRCLVPYFFLEIIQDLGNKRHKCVFKDLSCHTKLFELLFHLTQVHVIIDLSQLVEKHVHSFVVRNVSRHELLELFSSLLLGVHLAELLQRLQQILLEFRDIWAYE